MHLQFDQIIVWQSQTNVLTSFNLEIRFVDCLDAQTETNDDILSDPDDMNGVLWQVGIIEAEQLPCFFLLYRRQRISRS